MTCIVCCNFAAFPGIIVVMIYDLQASRQRLCHIIAMFTVTIKPVLNNAPNRDRLADEIKQLVKSYCNHGWQINITKKM